MGELRGSPSPILAFSSSHGAGKLLLVGLPVMRTSEDRPESLADFTRRMRTALGLSLSDVERQSARGGPKIAGSYVSRIENGLAKNPSPEKLKALARGFGITEEEVFAKVGGRAVKSTAPTMTLSPDEMKLILSYQDMSAPTRENLLTIAHALHRAEQKHLYAKQRRA